MKTLSLAKDKIRILLLEGIHPRARELFEAAGYGNVEEASGSLSGEPLARAISGVHFLGIRSRTQVTADVFSHSRRLAAVGCFCIGTNQVDLETAHDLGVPVFNAPFSNTRSVAELVLAEAILLMRGIPQRNAAAHRGTWLKSAQGSHEIRGKTLGIVGYGHIGTQLGVLAEGLGMKVVFHDIVDKLPMGNAEAADSLSDLLKAAHVVSLHVPQTPQTDRMINTGAIAEMRDGACLINASRGNVVEIEALRSALVNGKLRGAAVDVFPVEPKSNSERFESPLLGIDNVLITPHIGGSTLEAQQNIAQEVASKMVRYSDNGSTVTAVNFPEVSMPDLAGRHRVLHIHRNEPGVLNEINRIFSDQGINIAAQYLQTQGRIGYVVMDLEIEDAAPLMDRLKAVRSTIRTRVLY